MKIATIFLAIAAFVLLIALCLKASEAAPQERYNKKMAAPKLLEAEMKDLVYPVPETSFSRSVNKVLDNVDNFDGWSITGYSIGKLDADFNPYRIKIGVISNDNMPEDRYEEELDRFIHQREHGKTMIGIGFHKEF